MLRGIPRANARLADLMATPSKALHATRTVTADRGYGEKTVDDALHDLGVRTVVIPAKANPTQARREQEHRPAFRRTIKWRKGMRRPHERSQTRLRLEPHPHRHTEGTRIWAGHGILTHNLIKISALAA